MLLVLQITRTIHFTRPGRLLPWMGPALRGMLARPFKESVCRHSWHEQQTRWRYCTGCRHMSECAYGQTLEPDPPSGSVVFHGQEQAVRPVVLALPFPMPSSVDSEYALPLTLTFIGSAAMAHAKRIWQALADAGADPRRGFDPEHTTFSIEDNENRIGPEPIELPREVGKETVRQVRVELTGPLFLRGRGENGRRHHIAEPSFADLVRAALRTLGTLFALYDRPLAADFVGLKQAALEVRSLRSAFVSCYQPHHSSRSRSNRPLHGVVGSGTYGPVPIALIPWMCWAGRVHVGTDRVAGAGGWRVEIPEP